MNTDILTNMIINKFYSASTVYNEKNTKMKRELRPCWAIVIKFEGETVYTSKGFEYISNIHNMVILPKGCSYEWQCTKSGHYSIIEFDSDTVYDEIFYFKVKNSDKILSLFHSIEYKNTLKNPTHKMESIRDVYSLILMLIHSDYKKYLPTDKGQKIAPAIDYIAKNYNREITNEHLSRLTGLSTVYFRKLFREVFGTSPIAYVHDLRIKKAKEMLKSDYGSITEIAYSLGYLNIYDFSRDFKKHTGISPSKY